MDPTADLDRAMCLPFPRIDHKAREAEAQESEPAPLRLVVHPSGVTLPVTRADVILGRHSQADIRLPLPDVSRRHCRLTWLEGEWTIFDLDSLNGVHVNGSRVSRAPLTHRDVIRIGGCLLEVDLRSTPPTVALPRITSGLDRDPLYSIRDAIDDVDRKAA